jgi:hypothetical protein
MRGAFLLLLLTSMACHRRADTTEALPKQPVDGAYRFILETDGVVMEGRFVIADSQVFLDGEDRCELVDVSKTSDDQAKWFDCFRTQTGSFLQLRISLVDPVRKSIWHSRIRVRDTVLPCKQYTAYGECVQSLRSHATKWVDRYGAMIVTRGLPGTPPDSGLQLAPPGSRPFRMRCDTTIAMGSCNGREELQ